MFVNVCFFYIHYVFFLLIFIVLILLKPPYVMALDEERLWIPSNYKHLYLDLKKSAISVEASDSCETVLRGTLDFDASDLPDTPVFRILCRRSNGRTYNEMVVSQKFWTESNIEENKVKQDNALSLVQKNMQATCDMRLVEETEFFNELKRNQAYFSMVEFDFSGFSHKVVVLNPRGVFLMDFDAMDMYGVKLEYRAVCYIESGTITKMAIKKREEDTDKEPIDGNIMDK